MVMEATPGRNCRSVLWRCHCSCGSDILLVGRDLKSGHTQSCGCLQRELVGNRSRTHGESRKKSVLYATWKNMIRRCTNPHTPGWGYYGGRGTVCDRWRHSFENFRDDIGPHPGDGWSIDRIDNNLGYFPGNVRFATAKMQANNRRNSKPQT